MRRVLCLTVGLLVSLPASAQPKHRILDWKFWLGAASMFAAQYTDIATARRCIDAGTCRQGDPILGQSAARAYRIGMGVTAGEVATMYFVKKWGARDNDPDHEVLWLCMALFHDTLHGVVAFHNAGMSLRPACPGHPGVTCRQ